MISDHNALISIRPQFAEAILAGHKTVEVRRRIPRINMGTQLWIYATRPLAAIVGSAMVCKTVKGTPCEIWHLCKEGVGLRRNEYDTYLEGTSQAHGIFLSDVRRRNPIGIEQLREIHEGFHPPRVLSRLSRRQTSLLAELAIIHA